MSKVINRFIYSGSDNLGRRIYSITDKITDGKKMRIKNKDKFKLINGKLYKIDDNGIPLTYIDRDEIYVLEDTDRDLIRYIDTETIKYQVTEKEYILLYSYCDGNDVMIDVVDDRIGLKDLLSEDIFGRNFLDISEWILNTNEELLKVEMDLMDKNSVKDDKKLISLKNDNQILNSLYERILEINNKKDKGNRKMKYLYEVIINNSYHNAIKRECSDEEVKIVTEIICSNDYGNINIDFMQNRTACNKGVILIAIEDISSKTAIEIKKCIFEKFRAMGNDTFNIEDILINIHKVNIAPEDSSETYNELIIEAHNKIYEHIPISHVQEDLAEVRNLGIVNMFQYKNVINNLYNLGHMESCFYLYMYAENYINILKGIERSK